MQSIAPPQKQRAAGFLVATGRRYMDLEDRFIRRALRVAAGAGIVLLLSGASTVAAEATIPHPPPAVTEAVKELDSAWEQAPLSFTKALFIEAPASGYGLYTPRA